MCLSVTIIPTKKHQQWGCYKNVELTRSFLLPEHKTPYISLNGVEDMYSPASSTESVRNGSPLLALFSDSFAES